MVCPTSKWLRQPPDAQHYRVPGGQPGGGSSYSPDRHSAWLCLGLGPLRGRRGRLAHSSGRPPLPTPPLSRLTSGAGFSLRTAFFQPLPAVLSHPAVDNARHSAWGGLSSPQARFHAGKRPVWATPLGLSTLPPDRTLADFNPAVLPAECIGDRIRCTVAGIVTAWFATPLAVHNEFVFVPSGSQI